jgi:endoglucanase
VRKNRREPASCPFAGLLHKWLRDMLGILTGPGIGLALWNFHGSFGILDSGRTDVAYEDFHGHQLDRQLLALLQEFA